MDRTELEEQQLRRLNALLAEILPRNAFYQRKLGSSLHVGNRAAFRELPFTTKEELVADQAARPPYGANLTYPLDRYVRLHQTSGTSSGHPLRWLDTCESWEWILDCWRQMFAMIGIVPRDRLFFPFSFGPFLGFWAAFEGASRLGHFCLPAGGMTTAARLRLLLHNQVTIVCCTPTYALRMAETARAEGLDLADSAVRMLIVAGEPGGSLPALRAQLSEAWGARIIDHTGMTEIASLGMECLENPGGVHLLETECIPEVIDPDTGSDVLPGTEGELVLTNLGRVGSPLIRYRTGDRVVADPNPCACGRPWLRLLGGIRGRTDDMLVIRGNNVYPSAIENLVRNFTEITEFQIVVERAATEDRLRLRIESIHEAAADVARRLEEACRSTLHFRPQVELVAAGTLPRFEMKAERLVRTMEPGKP